MNQYINYIEKTSIRAIEPKKERLFLTKQHLIESMSDAM